MLKSLCSWIVRWWGKERAAIRRPNISNQEISIENDARGDINNINYNTVSYDENLLNRVNCLCLMGDWLALVRLRRKKFQYHSDRATLALLSAVDRIQTNNPDEAHEMFRHAVEWGGSKRLIRQILVARVHNMLGRAASILGLDEKARLHFEKSIGVIYSSGELQILGHARAVREMVNLDLLSQAADYVEQAAQKARQPQLSAAHALAHQKVVDLEIDWLRERILALHKQGVMDKVASKVIKSGQGAVLPSAKLESPEVKDYYGLHGLDKKLESYLDIDNGFFVELGANDGVTQSNTLYFEQNRGWRGVLIEPILHNFLKCHQNRSSENSIFCAACVSNNYDDPFVRLTYANLMTAPRGVESDIADPVAHARSGAVHLSPGEQPVEVMAIARTLTSLLDEAGAPSVMDLLSLDVEGAEIEVLKGLDHQRYRFRYLLVECRDPLRLGAYLSDVGYVPVDKLSQHDYLFCSR